MSDIWGNAILPQRDGFVFGEAQPNVPCLWFNSGGADTPEDAGAAHGMLLYLDSEGNFHPVYPMTRVEAVYGLRTELDRIGPIDEACKKKCQRFFSTAILAADSWVGDASPYTQNIPVSDIMETDAPHIGPVFDDAQIEAQKESWLCITMAAAANGAVVFTCAGDKPEVDIPIQIEVIR